MWFIKHKNYSFNFIIVFKNLFTNFMECSAEICFIKRVEMTFYLFIFYQQVFAEFDRIF